MAYDFKSQLFQAFAHVPSYVAWLTYEADLVPTYAYVKRVLKLLQWRGGPKRWRLKNPSHILFVDALNQVFPDARFWMTHRDVTRVIPSVADVYLELSQVYSDRIDKQWLGAVNVEFCETGMRRMIAFRDAGNDTRFCDIGFADFQRDPLAEIERLYAWLGEELTAETRAADAGVAQPTLRARSTAATATTRPTSGSTSTGCVSASASTPTAFPCSEDSGMTSVWTAGMAPERDLVFATRPDDPEMRESVSLWFFDDSGTFAAPRVGIEAEAASWHDRLFQANFAGAGGRVLVGPGRGASPSPIDQAGQPTIIGAGPVTFRCLEPFRRWIASFDGDAADGDVRDQIAGELDQRRRTRLGFDIEMTMAAPAWGQEMSGPSAEAGFMGVGYRFEQLFRATGTLHLDGETRSLRGTGLRIHRQSVRKLEGFWGHCWQSAVFPDGRAFGYIAYPPREDGQPTYNEGYIWTGERMIVARVIQAPWLRRIVADGDDASLVLESELGETAIRGTTLLSTFRVGNPDMGGGLDAQQTGVRYEWDGHVAIGMMERSSEATLVAKP